MKQKESSKLLVDQKTKKKKTNTNSKMQPNTQEKACFFSMEE